MSSILPDWRHKIAITTSQQSAFEDAVLALIAAELVDEDVQVSIGPLGDDSDRNYVQTLGGPSTQQWANLGAGRKRESLGLQIEVKAEVSGKGEEKVRAVRDKVDIYVHAIERALREGVNIPTVTQIRRVQLDEIDTDIPARGTGSDSGTRAERRLLVVTGLADLYVT